MKKRTQIGAICGLKNGSKNDVLRYSLGIHLVHLSSEYL